MKIYLSGAMASCMDTYKAIFAKKERELRQDGRLI